MLRLCAAAVMSVVLAAPPAMADTRLGMAEEVGCIWCARWDSEIAPIYPLTPEGIAAPLYRFDKNAPLPDDVTLIRPVVFTPTFLLLIDGQEVARIEGYPGEDFFWGLLTKMLVENDQIVAPS